MLKPTKMGETKLKAGNLWEKTSARGSRYLVGRLGGVRVLIFENRDRKGENDPTHVMYFADGEKRGDSAAARSSAPAAAHSTAPVRRQHRSRKQAAAEALYTPDPMLNDPLPPWLTGEEDG